MKKYRKTRSVSAATVPIPGAPHRPQRILVVDDEAVIRELGSNVLIRHGYEVDVAEDGAAAWETIQRNHYDLLVTDQNMPKVTGVELIQKLHAAGIAMPIIMIAGVLPKEELTQFPWLQPAAMLVKPYTIPVFLETVREVLRVTDDAREPVAPTTSWQNQPATDSWQVW